MFVARNGVFLEKEFLSKKVSESTMQLKEIREPSESVSAPTEPQLDVAEYVMDTLAPCWSERVSRTPKRFIFLTTKQHDILLLDNGEPKTYSEVVVGLDSERWLGAMRSEIESMHDNQV